MIKNNFQSKNSNKLNVSYCLYTFYKTENVHHSSKTLSTSLTNQLSFMTKVNATESSMVFTTRKDIGYKAEKFFVGCKSAQVSAKTRLQ